MSSWFPCGSKRTIMIVSERSPPGSPAPWNTAAFGSSLATTSRLSEPTISQFCGSISVALTRSTSSRSICSSFQACQPMKATAARHPITERTPRERMTFCRPVRR